MKLSRKCFETTALWELFTFSPCHPYQDIFFPTLLREGQARLNMSDHFNKETTTKSLFYLKYYKKFYLKYNLT